jgi:glycine/D-amino acid oxidase-like deaminating enzyme
MQANIPWALMSHLSVAIAGAGVFGAAAALALRKRGHEVTLVDPGPLPSPLAASTDISKVVRREYGTDTFYLDLGEKAIQGFRRWNEEWPEALYHEVGLLLLSAGEMKPGGFEYESRRTLLERGFTPERVTSAMLRERHPAWNADRYPDGIYQPLSGYARSGKVVERLVLLAREAGVKLREGEGFSSLLEEGSRVIGFTTSAGSEIRADRTLLATGAWLGHLLSLEQRLWATGHPVFHLRPEDPSLFEPGKFPVFTADIAHTGWYGFPLNDGVVKIARHAVGRRIHPEDPRSVTEQDHRDLRAFLTESIPALAGAEVVFTRLCLYSDTADGHFWIDEDPQRKGLFVAAGGSGHAFKFAPVLGDMIADCVEGKEFPGQDRFRWRTEKTEFASEEEARSRE